MLRPRGLGTALPPRRKSAHLPRARWDTASGRVLGFPGWQAPPHVRVAGVSGRTEQTECLSIALVAGARARPRLPHRPSHGALGGDDGFESPGTGLRSVRHMCPYCGLCVGHVLGFRWWFCCSRRPRASGVQPVEVEEAVPSRAEVVRVRRALFGRRCRVLAVSSTGMNR